MRSVLVTCTAMLCLVVLGPAPASADTAAHKFGRGLANMTTGVLALPGTIASETDERGAVGIPIGLAKGLGNVVARELVGVYEAVSAPLAVPANREPILEPEFPWQQFPA
jgi:putative exosortase-associated protein (TIGR04073 family)